MNTTKPGKRLLSYILAAALALMLLPGGLIAPVLASAAGTPNTDWYDDAIANAPLETSFTTVTAGGKLTKPADPAREGYTFTGWYKDNACAEPWDFDKDTVTGSITLYAGWETAAETWANPFTDINEADWFFSDVQYAIENGLFNGTSETTFSPNAPMTRGMLVTVLGRLHGVDVSKYEGGGFDDVAAGAYCAPYVQWARECGIVLGVGDNLFAPDESVSRQDMAAILLRYAEFIGKGPVGAWAILLEFEDAGNIDDYALEGVMFCVINGIVNGRDGDVFDPAGSATRAEVAAMLHRLAEAFTE